MNGNSAPEFDSAAAVTRSMLGWGVLAGPIYLATGVVLALSTDGFDLGSHQLSLLMLSDYGWIQTTNLIVSGVLVLIAALGMYRAMNRQDTSRATAAMVTVFGIGLIGSGIFPPDPMAGFPSAEPDAPSAGGLAHIVFGALQFLCLAIACFTAARWISRRGDTSWSRYSLVTGVIILVGFAGGVVLSQDSTGVLLLWIAVVAGYAWIAATSVYLWQTVPHPDGARRQ